MALPIKDYTLSTAVEGALNKARTLRNNVQAWKSLVDSGTNADVVMNILAGIKTGRDVLASYAGTAGIDAFARTEYNDATLNFSAELNAIVTACDNCISWIGTNFPKDANGYLLKDKIVDGVVTPRTFTPAGLSGLSTQLQTLLNAFS